MQIGHGATSSPMGWSLHGLVFLGFAFLKVLNE